MRVCPEACSLFWAALSLACFWYSRCRLEQAWHRVSSGMGGAPHSIQMPRSLALSLLSWVLRRINSLRSGVWARWRSYSRRFSCLASSSARVGSTRGFGVLGWGVAFRDVFTAGFFQLWGRPPLLAGFGREKVNSKVWPIAHSCGGTRSSIVNCQHDMGLSPRGRGNQRVTSCLASWTRSIPAWAGEPSAKAFSASAGKVYPRVGGESGSLPFLPFANTLSCKALLDSGFQLDGFGTLIVSTSEICLKFARLVSERCVLSPGMATPRRWSSSLSGVPFTSWAVASADWSRG